MRQVGVQVQDIGTFLCWQTYVDDPGRELGLAKLVHIAKPAELDGIPASRGDPAAAAVPGREDGDDPVHLRRRHSADNEGEVYVDGVEVDDSEWFGDLEKIQADFRPGVRLPQGELRAVQRRVRPAGQAGQRFAHRRHRQQRRKGVVHPASRIGRFPGAEQPPGEADPSLVADGRGERRDQGRRTRRTSRASRQAEKAAYEKAYVETVKERVTLASKIKTRNSDELREEERIVVYRKLIQDMLLNGVDLPDDRTRHVRRSCSTPSSTSTRCCTSSRRNGGGRDCTVAGSSFRKTRSRSSTWGPIVGTTTGTRGVPEGIADADPLRPPPMHLRACMRGKHGRLGRRERRASATTTSSPKIRNRPGSAARSAGCCSSTATTCATRF